MIEITEQDLRELAQSNGGENSKCISIYLPTNRQHPESQQNSIRFKNLAKSAVEQARETELFSADEASEIEKELEQLAENREFWNHRSDGLAWLYDQGKTKILEFQRPVPEMAVVADSLHIKPLIRIVQSADKYHVLALCRHSARLFAGTRDSLDEVHVEGVPATMQEALGDELTEGHLSVATYGGARGAMHHGHGGKDEEEDKDRDRYFRAVASAVEKHWSNPSRLPLVLVALDQHHAHFHKVSQDNYLLDRGVYKDPSSMSTDEIRSATWEVIRGYFDRQLANDVQRLAEAEAHSKGSTVVSDLIREANNGRVDLLIVEEDAQLPGQVDWVTGAISEATDTGNGVDDVMDDLAEKVLAQGGSVRIVRSGSLNSPSKAGGIFRY